MIQSKPHNVITLGQRETDNINRMITKSEYTSYKSVIWVQTKWVNLIALTK
jgi:hypothetical protein